MKEQVSALMDGELDEAVEPTCLNGLKTSAEARECWDLYHLIGDAMRGHTGGSLPRSFDERLAAEPTILAPQRQQPRKHRPAWVALSAAASFAAVAYVGWMALPFFGEANVERQATLATAPAPLTATAVATPMAETPTVIPVASGMGDYVLAHQRFSPTSAMAGVAPYARSVSEEASRR